jgi:hypothetical protein
MVTFIEQPFVVVGGPEKQGAQDAAAAALTLDTRASTRINTSRTNTATTSTKIILTCLRVLLVSYMPKGKVLYPGTWHPRQLILDARSKSCQNSPPAWVPAAAVEKKILGAFKIG